jgi:hypothetical protein
MELRGPRLFLRDFTLEDADGLVRLRVENRSFLDPY